MKLKFLVMPALAAMLLAACNNETINQSRDNNFPADGQVRITTDINNSSTSFSTTKKTLRDAPSQFEGKELYLTIDYNGEWSAIQDDIEWTKDDANNWTPERQILWKDDNTPCDIYAFSPSAKYFDPTTVEFTADLDQKTKGVANSDFATYTQLNKPASELLQNGHLPINFSHKMSQLNVKIKIKSGQKGLKINKVEILNCYYQANFNCKTGAINSEGYSATLSMDSLETTNCDGYFKANFAPTNYAARQRMLAITDSNNKIYYYSAGAKGLKFESGKSYTLNLRLGQDAVSLDPSSLTINDWDNGGSMSDDGGDVSVMEVGDFINTDGTTSKDYIKDKSVGIVCWMGDPTLKDKTLKREHKFCTHGLAFALADGPSVNWQNSKDSTVDKWIKTHVADKYETTFSNFIDPKGYNNTMALKAYNQAHTNKPDLIVNAITGLNSWKAIQPDGASPWFLPSIGDIILFFNNSDKTMFQINTKLEKLKNQGLNVEPINLIDKKWTSSEWDKQSSRSYEAYEKELEPSSGQKNEIYATRYMIAF